ncbi:MAG: DUF58 domain-containing protein [Candidatus Hydrogenedentota bacterium]
MIVPKNRLLFWAGVVLVPFLFLGITFGPGASVTLPGFGRFEEVAGPLAWTIVGLFVVLAALDAVLALNRLDKVSAACPSVVRFAKGREGEIPILIDNAPGRIRRVRLGIPLPRCFRFEHEDVRARLPEGGGISQITWPCTPLERGNYPIDAVHIETASLFGFWAVRRSSPTRTELRVYPNLQQERRNLAALFLNRGTIGAHAQRQVGKGREFEQLREYQHGDSYEDIHWKATAKRGHPITKTYQLERTQEVYVVVDASRLSARVTPPRPGVPEEIADRSQLERFLTASLVMGQAAERQGDLFGTLVYSDHVNAFVRARNGKSHYSACRDAIYTIRPRVVNPDFEELGAFIRLRMRRRALLVFLTNLDDPVLAESFLRMVDLIGRHHLLMVMMINPPGVQPLFSNPEVREPEDVYKELAGHMYWHDLREFERSLYHRGASLHLVQNEKLCTELVSQYMSIKQRQVL